jgi:formylglycine-generating enzyme required for sulfatase activity
MIGQTQAPVIGNYQIRKEFSRDALGITYDAVGSDGKTRYLLRVFDPFVINSENFIVRFELLKGILPAIIHPNLLEVKELGKHDSVYFMAKAYPKLDASGHLKTLANTDLRDLPNRHQVFAQVYSSLALGLSALENLKDSFYHHGITHDALTPRSIFLSSEKALIGGSQNYSIQIDGFAETFIYFGDSNHAVLQRKMAESQFSLDKEGGENDTLYKNEAYAPPAARQGELPNHRWHQYSFASIVYQGITRQLARGIYSPLSDIDSALDPLWEPLIERCLSGGYASMEEVATSLQVITKSHEELTPSIRKVKELNIPPGMSLVLLDDKVELGAKDGPKVEQPRFRARIQAFFIDLTPVTNKQFLRFLKDYQPSTYSKGDEQPATLVSWHMANAYCRWRSKQEKLPAGTYRLPTEFEWEAAARGTSKEQYPWGSSFTAQYCHCGKTQDSGTLPVTALPPSRFNLYSLLGNTWEWTESNFRPHPFSKHIEKGYSQKLYVVKGGCWYTPEESCRASLRAAFLPTEQRGNIGFRCVRSASENL